MTKMINLPGDRFNRLTLIERAPNGPDYTIMWYCLCSCGNTCTVIQRQLRSGKTKSCGCWQKELVIERNISRTGVLHNDLTGQVFDRLTVESYAGTYKDRQFYWCICTCGKQLKVRSDHLISRNTRSCGCLASETTANRIRIHGFACTKEYKVFITRRYRERKRKLDVGWTLEMNTALLEFQPICSLCSSDEYLAVDHVRPISKGFGLSPGNATVLCKSCNSRKKDKDLKDLDVFDRHMIIKASEAFLAHWTDTQKVLLEALR